MSAGNKRIARRNSNTRQSVLMSRRRCRFILHLHILIYFTFLRGARRRSQRSLRQRFAHHLHLEDCFPWAATKQSDIAPMVRRNALSEGQTEAGALLLSFAHKWLKQIIANLLGNASAVVDHVHDHFILASLYRHQDASRVG